MSEENKLEPQFDTIVRLAQSLQLWSAHCAKILSKDGRLEPFQWNRAQKYIHERLEKQLKETGKVRALILKGRQQGCSTLIAARFYHRTSTRVGQNAFIVAHEDKATSNLFSMVKRYHGHNPMAPSVKASNAQELIFGDLESGYKLATAGSKDVGRSNTARLAHFSEFAFWANAQSHLAGIGNTIPSGEKGRGTEIILESTANGIGNAFHLMWQDAEAGKGEYQAIFVPWFWQDEYRSTPKPEFEAELSDADRVYMQAYGLDLQQMQWRAHKIAEYGSGFEWLFDQEYPATPALAFRVPTGKPLISPSTVMAAVNSQFRRMDGPLIIGVDPASDGDDPSLVRDRTAIVFRRGRVVFRTEHYRDLSTMQLAGKIADYAQEFEPDAIFIDKGGIGSGIVDRLKELHTRNVRGVLFGEGSSNPEVYLNKRAEMWWRMKEWLEDSPCRLPNDASLIADLSAPQPKERSDRKKQLESKQEMAKRQIRSPDMADALALTFAHNVQTSAMDGMSSGGQPATRAGY